MNGDDDDGEGQEKDCGYHNHDVVVKRKVLSNMFLLRSVLYVFSVMLSTMGKTGSLFPKKQKE